MTLYRLGGECSSRAHPSCVRVVMPCSCLVHAHLSSRMQHKVMQFSSQFSSQLRAMPPASPHPLYDRFNSWESTRKHPAWLAVFMKYTLEQEFPQHLVRGMGVLRRPHCRCLLSCASRCMVLCVLHSTPVAPKRQARGHPPHCSRPKPPFAHAHTSSAKTHSDTHTPANVCLLTRHRHPTHFLLVTLCVAFLWSARVCSSCFFTSAGSNEVGASPCSHRVCCVSVC